MEEVKEALKLIDLIDKHFTVIITVFSTLTAVFLTGLIAYFIERMKIESTEKEKIVHLKNKKIEEIYTNFTIWANYFSVVSVYYLQFHNKKIDKDKLDMNIKDLDKINKLDVSINFDNLKMNIELYFPELIEKHLEIIKEFLFINRFSNSSEEINFSSHETFLIQFDKKCEDFKKSIANLKPIS